MFSITLSYILRCNSDVTSLLSGTQVKAIIAYITDYITKSSLKTYNIFETIRTVLEKNHEVLAGSAQQANNAC